MQKIPSTDESQIKPSMEYGVPQGTVLGTLPLGLHINDLFSLDLQGDNVYFVDDTANIRSSNSWSELKRNCRK